MFEAFRAYTIARLTIAWVALKLILLTSVLARNVGEGERSYTQLLERRYGDKLDDRARDFIGFASAGAVRMQSMVKDLLNYSRVGRLGSERELVDLKRVMERACANLMLQIDSNDAVIKIDGALPTIYGYRTMMLQLFQNMIENAIKFRVPDK